MKNVLFCANWGDTSLRAMEAEVLKVYPKADAIVNLEIDANYYNIFCFYMRTTVYFRGIAVQYR